MPPPSKSAFSGALIYLSRRPRTVKEVTDWLNKKEVPSDAQTEVIEKLTSLKLLNDYEYACSFIRTRNLIKPRSKRVLRMELMKKGVPISDIEKALEEVPVDESEFAKRLLTKVEWKWKELPPAKRRQKKMEYLMRKGYNWDIVKRAVGQSAVEEEVEVDSF